MALPDPLLPTGEQTYQVVYRGHVLGTSPLDRRDEAMAIAAGDFAPLPAYDAVRDVFLLFTQAHDEQGYVRNEAQLTRYYQARDALQLTLETAHGLQIPVTWIHIVDWGDLGRELEVHLTGASFWRHDSTR